MRCARCSARIAAGAREGSGLESAIWSRNSVAVTGDGPTTLVLVQGFGTQHLWALLAGCLATDFRVVTMNLAGFGPENHGHWAESRHSMVSGHAEDVAAVCSHFRDRRLVMVSHGVGAVLSILADALDPSISDAHVMISPRPFIGLDGDYYGGLGLRAVRRARVSSQRDPLAWAMAEAWAGVGDGWPQQIVERVVESMCSGNPRAIAALAGEILKHDFRGAMCSLVKPVLNIQPQWDPLSPGSVSRFLQQRLASLQLRRLSHLDGHYPHLVAPSLCAREIIAFLIALGLATQK